MEKNFLLTYLLLIPIIGSIIILFFKDSQQKAIKAIGLFVSIFAFVVSLIVYANFNSIKPGFQLVHQVSWVKSLNLSYKVGIDGLSMILVLLTTFLTPLTLYSSWESIKNRVKDRKSVV